MQRHRYSLFARVLSRVGLLSITGLALLLNACSSIPAPTEQIAVANVAVERATSAGSDRYAPLELKYATEKMDIARTAMAKKDYVLAQRMAEQAQLDAKLAELRTNMAKTALAVKSAGEGNQILRDEINRAGP